MMIYVMKKKVQDFKDIFFLACQNIENEIFYFFIFKVTLGGKKNFFYKKVDFNGFRRP